MHKTPEEAGRDAAEAARRAGFSAETIQGVEEATVDFMQRLEQLRAVYAAFFPEAAMQHEDGRAHAKSIYARLGEQGIVEAASRLRLYSRAKTEEIVQLDDHIEKVRALCSPEEIETFILQREALKEERDRLERRRAAMLSALQQHDEYGTFDAAPVGTENLLLDAPARGAGERFFPSERKRRECLKAMADAHRAFADEHPTRKNGHGSAAVSAAQDFMINLTSLPESERLPDRATLYEMYSDAKRLHDLSDESDEHPTNTG